MDSQNPTMKSDISYSKTLKYSIFFGWLGLDRFYIGDVWIGVAKLCLFIYIIPWLADIVVIRSHKNDWDEWIGAKQRRRAEIAQRKEAQRATAAQQIALENERAASGHCPKCNSDRLQAIGKTSSKMSLGSGNLLVDVSNNFKYNATHQKVQTKMIRVCLNCGHEF